MEYQHYTPVSVWKEKAKSLGLKWSDVRDCYTEIRAYRKEFDHMALGVRKRAFTKAGVSKSHRAFWQGDTDRDSIRGFDVLAANVASESPWACRSGDPGEDLYELMQQDGDDFRIRDDDAWREALARLEEYQSKYADHEFSDEAF